MSIIDLHRGRTGRLDEAARWSVGWLKAYPDEFRAIRESVRTLLELGACDEARSVYGQFTAQDEPGAPYRRKHWTRLMAGIELGRACAESGTGAAYARQLFRDFLEPREPRPVIEEFGWNSRAMTALALEDIHEGRDHQALERYLLAYPNGIEAMDRFDIDVWHPPVMTAALYKLTGEPGKARVLLEDYLKFVEALPDETVMIRTGWTTFTILAMLGQTDAALDELESMVDDGFLKEWWALEEGAFDPDYAAVLAHPRFEALYGRIGARVEVMREAYMANPDLPEGYLP